MSPSTRSTHTLQHSLEAVARARFVMPVVLVMGIVAMAINESTYQRSYETLADGIALTDVRVQAAETLQLLTDAGLYARSYILSGLPEEAVHYRETVDQMQAVKQKAFDLVAQLDPDQTISVEAIEQLVAEHVASSDQWVSLMAQGRREAATAAAISSGTRNQRDRLRDEFSQVLISAAGLQQGARITLYQTLGLSRLVIHVLALATILGMFLFQRQLRTSDRLLAEEHLRLAERVKERTADLTEMATHLVHAREDERAHLARDLHDELGGLLTAIKLDFARLRRLPGLPDKAPERMQSIELRLNEGIALKRRIIENLRPSSLEQLGLVPALEILCRDFASTLEVPIETDLQPVAVDKDAELTVFRVAQESLTNIGKYAHCKQVHVRLIQTGSWVQLTVRDDGRGFEPNSVAHGHHGLIGMRFRLESHGGHLTIDSAPGRGTKVSADLPANNPAQRERRRLGERPANAP